MAGRVSDMLAEARKHIGLGEPNFVQRWYRERNGAAYAGNFPWCDAFVTYVAYKSGCYASVNFSTDYAYTVYHAQRFQRAGQWKSGTKSNVAKCKPGDIVFFDWGQSDSIGYIDHVGIVEKNLGGGKLQTIEGNISDQCLRKVRDYTTIAGYGRPKYAPESSQKPAADPATVFGVDYAWGRPGVSALKSAGAKYVCRYVSHDTTGKDISKAEAKELSDAGIWVVLVWETRAARALDGMAAGAQDARDALLKATSVGMPADRPIYFAVDFDAQPSQYGKLDEYFQGVRSVLGYARTGVYAGFGPTKHLLDTKAARYAWQTYAWSGGKWDPRAQLQQYLNGQTLNGVSVDYDRAMSNDYGQWKVGVSPVKEAIKLYGQLANGKGAVTPISIHPGWASSIGFLADNGIQKLPPAKLRVAIHDAKGWYVEHLVVDSTKAKPWVRFRDAKSTDGVSVQREDDGTVSVAWDAS